MSVCFTRGNVEIQPLRWRQQRRVSVQNRRLPRTRRPHEEVALFGDGEVEDVGEGSPIERLYARKAELVIAAVQQHVLVDAHSESSSFSALLPDASSSVALPSPVFIA